MSVDKDQFRALAGSYPAGITVVTSGEPGAYYAMTISAFAALSAEPPLVVISVELRAESAGIIQTNGRFNVNILNCDQSELSTACATRGSPERRLEGVESRLGDNGLPLIENCLANLECRLVDSQAQGDHYLFIGEVERGDLTPGLTPLLYHRGGYGAFARQT